MYGRVGRYSTEGKGNEAHDVALLASKLIASGEAKNINEAMDLAREAFKPTAPTMQGDKNKWMPVPPKGQQPKRQSSNGIDAGMTQPAQQAQTTQAPMSIVNKQTGQRMTSKDGGLSWTPVQ